MEEGHAENLAENKYPNVADMMNDNTMLKPGECCCFGIGYTYHSNNNTITCCSLCFCTQQKYDEESYCCLLFGCRNNHHTKQQSFISPLVLYHDNPRTNTIEFCSPVFCVYHDRNYKFCSVLGLLTEIDCNRINVKLGFFGPLVCSNSTKDVVGLLPLCCCVKWLDKEYTCCLGCDLTEFKDNFKTKKFGMCGLFTCASSKVHDIAFPDQSEDAAWNQYVLENQLLKQKYYHFSALGCYSWSLPDSSPPVQSPNWEQEKRQFYGQNAQRPHEEGEEGEK